jgi:large subunit ribosomal protein L25
LCCQGAATNAQLQKKLKKRLFRSFSLPITPVNMESRIMADITTLAAAARTKSTKGAVSAIRNSGNVPAVIYGDKQAPALIAIESKLLARQLETSGFMTRLFDLEIGGKKYRVLPRDVQFDPVSDRPLHVDFLRVSANTRVRVSVPVAFMYPEKSPGIKRGGTLNVVHHEIEVTCAPDKIPARFEVSLEGLQINDAVHLSALILPKEVKLTTHEKDFTIATIAVPSAIRSENEAAATAAATPAAAAPAAGATPAAGAAAPAAGAAAPAAGAAKKPEAKK